MKLKGLYLVVDCSIEKNKLLKKIIDALEGGIDIIQVWSNWKDKNYGYEISKEILRLTKNYNVPVLINNDYKLANEIKANGVHFDDFKILPKQVKKINENLIVGYTIGNDLNKALFAEKIGADYISFCSCFPTPSVDKCEIVPLSTIKETKNKLKIPVFASGGITLENVEEVLKTGVDGIAVISAILKAENPKEVSKKFKEKILKYIHK